MTRPLIQHSYRNYLKKLKDGYCVSNGNRNDNSKCNTIKCNPDRASSDEIEMKKARVLKDLSYNYVSECISCKKKCSNNDNNNKCDKAFPPSKCKVNTQKCNTKAIMSKLHVKRYWCNTVKDLGMRGADARLAALKSKVLTCRNEDGSAKTDLCDCIKTNKNCA